MRAFSLALTRISKFEAESSGNNGSMDEITARSVARPPRRWLPATTLAAVLGLTLAACSSDSTTTEEPTVVTSPEPAPGAADNVVDGSEGGQVLDDGNVPGTANDTDIDEAEDN